MKPNNSEIGFKFTTSDLSNFDKQCSDANLGLSYFVTTVLM